MLSTSAGQVRRFWKSAFTRLSNSRCNKFDSILISHGCQMVKCHHSYHPWLQLPANQRIRAKQSFERPLCLLWKVLPGWSRPPKTFLLVKDIFWSFYASLKNCIFCPQHYQYFVIIMAKIVFVVITRRCTTVRNSDDHAIPLRWARTPICIWVNYEWSIESQGGK